MIRRNRLIPKRRPKVTDTRVMYHCDLCGFEWKQTPGEHPVLCPCTGNTEMKPVKLVENIPFPPGIIYELPMGTTWVQKQEDGLAWQQV